MRLILTLLTILFLLSSCSAAQLSPKNIILVLADDLGYNDISPYNAAITYTPNIQWLADNGATLTEFYTPVSVCTPTRASLLTGQHPATLDDEGLLTVILPKNPRPGLDQGDRTLAGQLRLSGYRTGIIGKWHLGDAGPMANGFDYGFWLPYGNSSSILELWENDTRLETYPDFTTINIRFLDKAKQFISEGDSPFFLYVPHIWPHVPLLNDKKPGLDYYQSSVAEIDDLLGSLLAHLRDTGQLDNTIIIVTSDNGPNQADQIDENGLPVIGWNNYRPLVNQGIYPDSQNPERWIGGWQPFKQPVYDDQGNLVLQTGKGKTWEGGIRVPFVAYGLPLEDRPMSMVDLYDWLLTGQQPVRDMFHYYNGNRHYGAIRRGDWKLHVDESFRALGLYRLDIDAKEVIDLKESYPDLVTNLARQAQMFDLEARGQKIRLPIISKAM